MPAAPRSNMKATKIAWDLIGVPDPMKKYSRIRKAKQQPAVNDSFVQKPE